MMPMMLLSIVPYGGLTLAETAPCTRCGSLIHSRVKLDPEFVPSAGASAHHVICVGCSFEWVE